MGDLPQQQLAELLNRIGRGDDRAASTLYRHYYAYVHAFIRYRIRDEQAAEEIAHDVFLAVCRNPAAFQGQAKFSTWLGAIASNKSVDWLRRRGRTTVAEAEGSDEVLAAIPDPSPDLIERMGEAQHAEIVRRCIDALPEKHRQVVFLAYYEEAGVNEIARQAGCPEGTVKSRLSHARAKLLDCVSAWLSEDRHA